MLDTRKVIWREGMYLQPQHFQQAERFLLEFLDSRLRFLNPHSYGITSVSIDSDALANNLLSLTHCSGILADGTLFELPGKGGCPQARSFSDHFTHDLQTLDVYLALPLSTEGESNTTQPAGAPDRQARYRATAVECVDEVSGSQRKSIEVGSLNFVILFGGESLDHYASLRIARLHRTAQGMIALDESYIPPLLRIGACPGLMVMLRGLLELLLAKISSLSQARRQAEGGFAEFSKSEETAFRLLQTLNAYAPLLNHHHFAPSVHPYELFRDLEQLAGALCTFSAEVSIRNLPRYDHHNLSLTFATLAGVVRTVLGSDISAGCVTIAVEKSKPAIYTAKVPDRKLFSTARFYFGVSVAGVGEKELIVGVLQRIKVCSLDRLDALISSAMPGLQLVHSSNLPEDLSTKPGFLYFVMSQQGPFWQDISQSGTIGFYFPNNFADVKMEILALKQQ